MLSTVAVPAKHLKRRIVGESFGLELSVKGHAALVPHKSPVCGSILVDVIQCEEVDLGFSAAPAPATIGLKGFFSDKLVGYVALCIPFFFAAPTMHTLILGAKILATLCAKTKMALLIIIPLSGCRESGRALSAAESCPIWRKLVSASRAESISLTLFVPFSLTFRSLGHVTIPPNGYSITPGDLAASIGGEYDERLFMGRNRRAAWG